MAIRTALVVDDEPQIRQIIRLALQGIFPRVLQAGDARTALSLADAERPELVVLDLGLPDRDGIVVCRGVRSSMTDALILVLSARDSDIEKAALLDAGADDYMSKPFSRVEFEARVRALLRRAARADAQGHTIIEAGDLTIDVMGRTVRRRGEIVHLTPTEWEVLKALAIRSNRTLTHHQLFEAAWRGQIGRAHV